MPVIRRKNQKDTSNCFTGDYDNRFGFMQKILCILCLLTLTLTGCGYGNSNENNKDMTGYKIDYKTNRVDSGETGENIYEVNGQNYSFLIRLTGRSENAKYDSYYVVLTNNSDLSFEDVDIKFWGSHLTSEEDFVIVEYGLIDK